MRIRGATTELEEAGLDMEGMASSTAELREEIKALSGVDIMINDTTFKSTYQIIEELAAKWKDLNDIQQASLTELIAGKRQGNIVSAIMENFDIADSALQSSIKSTGSAMKEYETYLGGIEAKTKQFKATFEVLADTLIGSDFVIQMVEWGTAALNGLNVVAKLIDSIGGLNTILFATASILAIIKAESIKTWIYNIGKSITGIIPKLSEALKILTGLGESTALMVPGTNTLSLAMKTLGISVSTAQVAMAGLVAVIGVAILAYNHFKQKHEELIQASNDLNSKFADFQATTESNRKTLESLSDEFDELSRGVDRYGENISLTADEYARYKEIVEKIVGISPDVVESYDKENGYIVDKNRLIERSIALLDEEYQAELRNMATTNKLSTSFASAIDDYNSHANSDALTSETTFNNSIWKLLNVNDRDDIPKEYETGEFLAREILTALGYDDVDEELKKYFNEHDYWQSGWFQNDYLDEIAEDIASGNSKIIQSIDWDDAGFEDENAFLTAVEDAKSAAVAYNDIQTNLASANDAIGNQLSVVAESNSKYAQLSEDTQKVVDSFVKSFGVEDVSKKNWLGQFVADDAINSVKVQINDLIETLSSPKIQSIIDKGAAVKLGVNLDGKDATIAEYKDLLDDFQDELDKIEDEELKTQIKVSLGIENDEALNKDVDRAIRHIHNLLMPVDVDEIKNLYDTYKNEISQAAEAGANLDKTLYGNIDLNNRQRLDWTSESLSEYKDALQSWEDAEKQWNDIYNDYFGSYSTVDARSEEFDGVEIAFTPMLQTENGVEYLSSDTVRNYINSLIDKANADGSWTNEELFALDAEGIEQDSVLIRNLIADIGDTAIKTGETMHYIGVDGSVADSYKQLSDAAAHAGLSIDEVFKAIESGDTESLDKIDELIDEMSVSEVLQIYYNISAEPNSMTFDELQKEMKLLDVDWSKTVNVWDFSETISSLGDIESEITDITSAMATLRNGTALTVEELAKLALKYPELLKASDLFTSSSIDNQKELLNAVLNTYESEYDALLDTKIAELTATNQLIKDQITLENEKKDKVIEIADLQNNGKIDSEKEYQRLLNDLRDLEGRNYVTYSDGVLDVNQDLLEEMLSQENEKVKDSEPIFGAMGNLIADSNAQGLTNALKTYPKYLSNLRTWASTSLSKVLSNIGTAISDAFSGKGFSGFANLFSGVNSISSVASIPVSVEAEIEGDYSIDEKSVDKWAAEYSEVIESRIETLTEQISANDIIIDNLTKLKGLDLTSLYSDDAKDSSGSKVKEYIADIDEYYEALKRLEAIQLRLKGIENAISLADDDRTRIELTKQLVSVYQDEMDALEHLESMRTNTIKNGIEELEELGFQVQYNAEANEFYVSNLEHLNELQAESAGEYKTVLEATNALREGTEELIGTLDDLNVANQDSENSTAELAVSIKESKNTILDYLNSILEAANEAVDGMQAVFETLNNAANEYADSGYITVDTLQDIISLGVEYMAFLKDENGQLVINKENIQKVIAARTEQLAVESALNYVEQLGLALSSNSADELERLLRATNDATTATWGLVYANLAYLNLDSNQHTAALNNINALRSLADNAIANIGSMSSSMKEIWEEQATALDDLLSYVEDMIKQEIENQISALEDQVDKYREIVDLQKESLRLEREKDQYTKDVADKTKSIAELQARITQLDLDDSREAQAEKKQLQAQLAEEQADLAETQADHAYDTTNDMLDKMADAYEDEKQREIEVLENSISSAEKIYRLALARIESASSDLKNQLISWNYEYGSVTENTLVSCWNTASQAVQQYGGYLNAVLQTQKQIASFDAGNYGNVVGNTGDYDTTPDTQAMIHNIIKEMYSNSQSHHSANTSQKEYLNKRNLYLGETELAKYGITAKRGDDGVWYVGQVGGELLYDKYKKYTYHTGGIVGDDSTPKQDEMFALLKKREAVMTEPQQEVIYRVLKEDEKLSSRIGIGSLYQSMDGVGYAATQSHNAIRRDMQDAQTAAGNSHVTQSVGDVTVPVHVMVTEKIDKSDIKRLSREIGDVASQEIYESFARGGTTTLKGRMLRPK